MTDNIITRNMDLLQKLAKGQPQLQPEDCTNWLDCDHEKALHYISHGQGHRIRVKPEPVWVAWDDETRPKGPIVVDIMPHVDRIDTCLFMMRYNNSIWETYDQDVEKWVPTTWIDAELVDKVQWHHSDGTITPCGTEVSP